ncbi:MAG: hypothetical protein JJ879_02190 [Sneathiella sp.]|nr:hypothetical protein [Sneathiella sp.]
MCVKSSLAALSLAAGLSLATSSDVMAQPPAPSTDLINKAVIGDLYKAFDKPVVKISVLSQNKKHANIGQAEIDSLDKQWREERKKEDQPLIASTLTNPLSSYLTQIQSASLGLYTEIFVMDSKGLNVGQSAISSDYWQGDEAKFQQTFPKGSGVFFIDEPEFDEDRQIWRVQLNATVSDGKENPIGAITVEFNLTELARRAAQS